MEQTVRESIGVLRRAYEEKWKALEAEREKISEYAERYIDENNIGDSAELLWDLATTLPYWRMQNHLMDRVYDLSHKDKEGQGAELTDSKDAGQPVPCKIAHHNKKAFNKIKRMAGVCRKKEQEFMEEHTKLQEFIDRYLDENGIREDVEKVDEMIDILPAGVERFFLLAHKYSLLEKKEAQDAADGVQVPGGIQDAGMGGIK